MCSFAVQIIYGIVGTIVLGMTITSLAMDSWTRVSDKDFSGLLCPIDKVQKAIENKGDFSQYCSFNFDQFKGMDYASQIILITIILAIVAEIMCLTYNFFTACACCCKTVLLPVLTGLSLITVLLLGAAVGVYVNQNEGRIGEFEKYMDDAQKAGITKDLIGQGNSFIFATVAFIGAILNTIVSFVAIFCAATLV
ncbi:hypothetical protein PFISCL1PPCAC_19457 [Pristionchus fissidentatus]|uniref:Uncharacterized protein n=1 Tax=Pristionchus fissidentatus TaxID=1538716 RepID=A0AAV5W8X1_9BILA|nr:hypothetical protein PFISCL1PPCAC_19457 [Pristionchus fissidentatus]